MFFLAACMGHPVLLLVLLELFFAVTSGRPALAQKQKEKPKKETQKVQAEMEAAQEREEIRAAHNPVKAKIIVSNTSKKAGSAAIRTAIGSSIAGLPGAVYGAASAKSKTSVTFYVTYEDGHSGTETVKSDSSRFLKLMNVCED